MTFENHYPQNPWAQIASKTRDWYVPDLYRIFTGQAVYNPFVNVQFNMNGLGATQMHITQPGMPMTNTDPIGARDLWLDASYMGSNRRTITFSQYGGKFAYHKYDPMITYWRQNGVQGLRNLVSQGMGHQITWTLEKLARNAFLSNSYATFGSGSGAQFDTIGQSDTISTQSFRDIWLGMKERGSPFAETSQTRTPGSLFMITTPGVVADLLDEVSDADKRGYTFTDAALYTGNTRALNGEVGMYQRTRIIESNLACLYNCGDITTQTAVKSPIAAGDGAPNPTNSSVDSVWYVGEAGATHYITVASNSGFEVGDVVTLHKLRTSDFGITNGVDYRDGTLQNLRIVAKTDADKLVFDNPVLKDFSVDLGGTVYGYITKGRHVHTALFVNAGQDGVVNGILQPPQIYTPDPVDDRQAQFRFTWDAYLKYQLFNPQAFEVLYLAGSNRFKGPRYIS